MSHTSFLDVTLSHTHFLLFMLATPPTFFFFFFNDTATTEIYTLSLHDALPIWVRPPIFEFLDHCKNLGNCLRLARPRTRSEEHTSELQSRLHLVCRLLLEKKKKKQINHSANYTVENQTVYCT